MVVSSRRPRISIVTPSLNQGRFLQACLDSVAAQNWPDIEHFVIDGGSTDDTLEIIERNRSRLTGFVSEPDKGAADAINKGLAKCTGDIVAWLNADDFYLPGAFERVVAAWRADPDAAFWFGNGVRVYEDGKFKSTFNPHRVRYNHRALLEGLDYILQPATFINAQVLTKAGPLDDSLRWSFDWELWLRLAKHAPPATIEAKLAASREWGSTLTASGSFRRVEEIRRMAESYCGKPITHGVLCYWLSTLIAMRANPTAFGSGVHDAAQQLWKAVQADMRRLNVDIAGMPLGCDDAVEPLVIAVDLYPLLAGVSGGIVPWVQGVLREMVRLFPTDRVLMFHRPGAPPLQIQAKNVEYIPLHEHPGLFYRDMTRLCEEAQVQVVIRTYPQELHPALPLERQIFVIPDIQHEFFPEFFAPHVLAMRRRAFAHALSRGAAVATMTEHSRSTLLSQPWTTCRDIFLMPAALPEELRVEPDPAALPPQASAFNRFFYMPANLWAHKNHRRLFEAFKRALPELPPNTGLVLTGNPDGYAEIRAGYEDLPIVHLGYVPHEQVAALFRAATALVFFSQFEGFGMPLLEAFYHGTPVLCSNSTSLPEVGGDAVLACDPTDVDAMAGLMLRIVNETGLREQLSAKAAGRLAVYDWATPARELRAALTRAANAVPAFALSKEPPLISIVMPTRNHARFIRDSIDSVLQQDYPRVELIVMDGASTDETVEILKSFGDRIDWHSEPDQGQSDAINKGMAKAKGDILAYLNSDDVLLPGALEKVAMHFERHPECDMVYGNADYINEVGDVIGSYTVADFSFERLMHDCCVCQPAAFWRRRIAERVGPFNRDLQTAMDYDYWLRIASSGGIVHHTMERLAQSRLHDNAKTLSMRGRIYEEVFAICKEHGGYVSLNYYNGLWHYRMFETWSGGKALRRVMPRAYHVPAVLHFSAQSLRLRRRGVTRQQLVRSIFDVIDRRSPFAGGAIRKAWRYSSTLRGRVG